MNEITIHGSVTADPTLSFGRNGAGTAFTAVSVAVNRSHFDRTRNIRTQMPTVLHSRRCLRRAGREHRRHRAQGHRGDQPTVTLSQPRATRGMVGYVCLLIRTRSVRPSVPGGSNRAAGNPGPRFPLSWPAVRTAARSGWGGTSEARESVGALGEELARLPHSAVGLGRRVASVGTEALSCAVRSVSAGERHDGRVDLDGSIEGGFDRVRLRDHHSCVESQQPKAEQPSMNHGPDQHRAFAVRAARAATHAHGPGGGARRTVGS